MTGHATLDDTADVQEVTPRWWRRLDRALVGVLALAVFVRVVWAVYASRGAPGPEVVGDQYSYWHYGHEIAAGRGYVSYTKGTPTAYYPIGFPFLIAAVVWVVDLVGLDRFDVTAVVLLQLALGVLAVWFVYLLAEAVVGRHTALVAAGIVALFPNLVYGTATFSLESAYAASYLGALVIIVRHDWRAGPPSLWRVVAFGFAIGLSSQIRPFSMPMLLGLVAAALVAGLGWKWALKMFAVAAGCALLVFVPWTIRNAVRLHAFVPSSTNLGDTVCMARFPGSDGGFHWSDHAYCGDPSLPDVERNKENIRGALRFVRDHPGEEVELVGRRFVLMWADDHSALDEVINNWGVTESSSTHLPVLAGLADAYYWVVVVLTFPGLVWLVRHRRGSPSAAVLAVAAVTLFVIPLGLWGNVRFHLPLLPLLAIPAAVAIVQIATRLRPSATAEAAV